jgi:hypothetical protein
MYCQGGRMGGTGGELEPLSAAWTGAVQRTFPAADDLMLLCSHTARHPFLSILSILSYSILFSDNGTYFDFNERAPYATMVLDQCIVLISVSKYSVLVSGSMSFLQITRRCGPRISIRRASESFWLSGLSCIPRQAQGKCCLQGQLRHEHHSNFEHLKIDHFQIAKVRR